MGLSKPVRFSLSGTFGGSNSKNDQLKEFRQEINSSSKYVNELEDVVIFCNKEGIVEDFINNEF